MERKSCVLFTIIFLVALLGIFPRPVISQGNTWVGKSLAQMVEAARWRKGALRINASLALTNAGYDTDIYYGYFDEAVPDYSFSAALPVQVLLPLSKKVVLDLFESPQYLFYLESGVERAWNNIFKCQVHFALERIYIQAGWGLSNVRQRLSPELNINIRQKEDNLNATLLWQVSQGMSFALLHKAARYDYGDAQYGGISIAETLNRNESYVDFVTYLQPSSKVRLFVDGQYGSFSFAEEAARVRDSQSYGVVGGLEFIPRMGDSRRGLGIQGRLSLGYKWFNIIDPLLRDGSSLVGAVNLSAGLFDKTSGRAFFSRDFQFSALSGASIYISTAFGGGITRLISRRISLSYDISFGHTAYLEEQSDGGAMPAGLNNQYTINTFSLTVSLARNLEIIFLGTLGKRSVNESGLFRNRNFFGFNMVYGFVTGPFSAPTPGLSR